MVGRAALPGPPSGADRPTCRAARRDAARGLVRPPRLQLRARSQLLLDQLLRELSSTRLRCRALADQLSGCLPLIGSSQGAIQASGVCGLDVGSCRHRPTGTATAAANDSWKRLADRSCSESVSSRISGDIPEHWPSWPRLLAASPASEYT